MLIYIAPSKSRLADPRRTVEMDEPCHDDRPYAAPKSCPLSKARSADERGFGQTCSRCSPTVATVGTQSFHGAHQTPVSSS
jgi:hypothetical protein